MQIIKKKILLEDYISREESTWGTPKWELDSNFNSFNINVFISQDMDDIGIATDLDFIPNPDASFLFDPKSPSTRHPGQVNSDLFFPGLSLSAYTEERLDLVKSYDLVQRYKPLFDMDNSLAYDYQGNQYTSITRVITNLNQMPITYIDGGDINETINTSNPNPQLGLFFKSYSGTTRTVNSEVFGIYDTPLTKIYYKGQGFNETNSSLSALTKEEYLFGITTTPTVFSDVFIDRGRTTVLQSHMQLGEIVNVRDLLNYGNGYYKIQK